MCLNALFCFFLATSIKLCKTIHINNLDKLVDKSISFRLMYSLTGFHGFVAILWAFFWWNPPKMQMSTGFQGGVSIATIRSSNDEGGVFCFSFSSFIIFTRKFYIHVKFHCFICQWKDNTLSEISPLNFKGPYFKRLWINFW